VREDPVRRGLLFAGADCGVFVSLNDGATWKPFQQNLPVTPVTDLKIVRGDLVLSTMGRAFWVLDDITPLRQPAIDDPGGEAVLFAPDETIRYRTTYRGREEHPVPDYPAPAAIIDYYLPEDGPERVTLEIFDAEGHLVNAFATAPAQDGEADDGGADDTAPAEGGAAAAGAPDDDGPIDESVMRTGLPRPVESAALTADAGGNRFRWNMRHAGPWHEDEDRRYRRGPLAAPGRYTLRLTAGATVLEQALTLRADPRVLATGTSLDDIRAQERLALDIVALLSRARRLEHELAGKEEAETLTAAEGEQLERLRTPEGIYMQPMLADQIAYLYGMLIRADQAPGRDAMERFETLRERLEQVEAALGD
jgi:hypothetical protein